MELEIFAGGSSSGPVPGLVVFINPSSAWFLQHRREEHCPQLRRTSRNSPTNRSLPFKERKQTDRQTEKPQNLQNPAKGKPAYWNLADRVSSTKTSALLSALYLRTHKAIQDDLNAFTIVKTMLGSGNKFLILKTWCQRQQKRQGVYSDTTE